jgi:hypothetical protein
MSAVALADASSESPNALFSLAAQDGEEGGGGEMMTRNWDVEGPVRMRGYDIQDAGTLDIKNTFGFATASDGSDDDANYTLQLQWGLSENHELNLYVPVTIGDGSPAGNADASIGWQWNLFADDMLSFGVYQELRVPTGWDSSGFDYEVRGVFSHAIQADQWRLHVNPFAKFLDGDNIEEGMELEDNIGRDTGDGARDFQWGVIIGTDYRLADDMVLNIDYVMDSGEVNGASLQHTAEMGVDWEMSDSTSLNFSTHATLDGDRHGDNWGFSLQYVWTLDDFGRPVVSWED